MRQSLNTPGGQLRSACERYAGPWTGRMAAKMTPAENLVAGTIKSAEGSTQKSTRGASGPQVGGQDEDLARVEAILFLSREPLSSRKLSQYANLADGTQARTLVRRLNEQYDAAERAFRVEQVAGGFQLLTRRKFAPWLARLAHVPEATRLSGPTLETL